MIALELGRSSCFTVEFFLLETRISFDRALPRQGDNSLKLFQPYLEFLIENCPCFLSLIFPPSQEIKTRIISMVRDENVSHATL